MAKLDEEKDILAGKKRKFTRLTGKNADDRSHYPNHCYKKHPIQLNDPSTVKRRLSKVTGEWIETPER